MAAKISATEKQNIEKGAIFHGNREKERAAYQLVIGVNVRPVRVCTRSGAVKAGLCMVIW